METRNVIGTRADAGAALAVASAGRELAFEYPIGGFGRFQLRPLRIPEDISLVHSWVDRERAAYWGLVGRSEVEVEASYVEIARHAQVLLGYHDATPAFLVEVYDPSRDPVGKFYAVQSGDRGMHVLTAPSEQPRHGFSWAVFRVVMAFLFSDARTQRVVVEPDIRNSKIHVLNRRAGFRYEKMIDLPHKTAHLAFCTRAQYREVLATSESRAASEAGADGAAAPQAPTRQAREGHAAAEQRRLARTTETALPHGHLTPQASRAANTQFVRKAISELSHERVLEPRLLEREAAWGRFVLGTDVAETEYRFRARLLELEHWDIDAASITKWVRGVTAELDALAFILDLRTQLGIDPSLLPVYLEEVSATLSAAAYKHACQRLTAADLVHAEFQEVEAAMTEGHPCFIANSGRVGFDAADYLAYAPETAANVKLVWLAAHRRHAEATTLSNLRYELLLREELGAAALDGFDRVLGQQGLDPSEYLLIPAHPWQWFNQLALVFAADIATRDLVCLGYGPDDYQPQQSIRTFFNVENPRKHYVKTALSVLNMGFMRGLSADYMRVTPAINEWLQALLRGDRYFERQGFAILREVAAVGYRNPRFDTAVAKTSPYRKMLAALWRESPSKYVGPGQRLLTMAALLHRDNRGAALLPQLIRASGVAIDVWLDRYFACYLAPLLHCFFRYDLAFMPHGENVILLLHGNVPSRAFMKDIAEEVVVMDVAAQVPENIRRICAAVPEDIKALCIFTDVFDGIFRYLAQILLEHAGYPERHFWQRVASCIHAYERSHPELSDKIARYDLFAAEFRHSCLNRLQLRNNRQMVDLTEPAGSLQFAGTLRNPIAPYRDPGPLRAVE